MKEQFLNIFNASTPAQKLKFNRRLSAVLVCFFIASIFWLLIALAKDYSATLELPVSYKNLPGQKVVVNDLPSRIALNVRTSGFKIFAYNFSREKTPVEIDVSGRLGAGLDQTRDLLVIPTKTFSDDFSEQFGGDVTIVNFIPDTIVFNFSNRLTRRVPVKLDLSISFEKQYDSIGVTKVEPDSVFVSGPGSVINEVNFISTEHVSLDHVKEPVKKKIKLVSNKLFTLSDTVVKVSVAVEKFTEENIEVPVRPIHVEKGYSIKTFPDKVTVRYQVGLSRYNQVTPSLFEAVVDAARTDEQKSSKLNVRLMVIPPFVKSVTIDPERVDYILRKQ